MNPFTTCSTCNGELKIIDFDELPEEMQKTFEGIADIGFYCAQCESYTVGGVGGLDDDLDIPAAEKMRFASKPAANNPCPCGSGKKYKRCCGLN